MNIQEVKKKRISYEKDFKKIEGKLLGHFGDEEFADLEKKQNTLYKKIILCNMIIDSYNASDEEDVQQLLKILEKGSVL